jgi:hypothetical protein
MHCMYVYAVSPRGGGGGGGGHFAAAPSYKGGPKATKSLIDCLTENINPSCVSAV